MKNDDALKKIKKSLGTVMEPRRWLLLVGTGTSIDLEPDLGMPALKRHLLDEIPKDIEGWGIIAEKLENNISLESALSKISLSEALEIEIAKHTSKFIAEKDAALRDKILTGRKKWVAKSLLKHLKNGLSPTWPCLPLVTTNYDMLIEYSCSNAGIPYITGYHGGIVRRLNWKKVREQQYKPDTVPNGKKRSRIPTPIPRVELMKVHGSINLFRDKNKTLIESDLWIDNCPEEYTPLLIAPPGDAKIQDAINHHEALFSEASSAINKATAFFAIGYGFNDFHVHQRILDRVREYNFPLIVLTLDPTEELDKLIELGKKVWVITGKKGDQTGTRFMNQDNALSGSFDEVKLWKSDVFTEQILGG